MKLLVQTTGQFQLLDVEASPIRLIRAFGMTVIDSTNFAQMQVAEGKIDVVGKLKDEATDEEWLKYVAESDGDVELAKGAFLSSFEFEAEPKEVKSGPKGKTISKG